MTTGDLAVGIVILLCIVAAHIVATRKQSGPKIRTPRETCQHNWTADYDPADVARIYNDGFNAYTDRYLCTKCGKKKVKKSGLDKNMMQNGYHQFQPITPR